MLAGLAGVSLTLGLALSACATPPPAAPSSSPPAGDPTATTAPSPTPQPVEVGVIASGLQAPWSIAVVGEVALISERDTARMLEITPDGVRELGVIDGVAPGGEGGLLGIAVQDRHVYVYFTSATDNRIVRYSLDGEPGAFSLGDATLLLEGIPRARNHHGGRIAFGPDGMLYATTGDAGDPALSQHPDALAGKILRMTPSGGVPDDNPFGSSYVYTLGHRNPQGLAWDESGTLYASEFGQHTWDELNIIEAGGNYGWPEIEGIAGVEGFIDPVQQWSPADASPSGIAIVGDVLAIANLRGERLRLVPLSDPSTSSEVYVGEYGRLRDVVAAPGGGFWILTNNTDGRGDPAGDDDLIVRVPAG